MSAAATVAVRPPRPGIFGALLENTSVYELPFLATLCALAASLPNESLFGGYNAATGKGFRSPSYYLGVAAAALSFAFFPRLARAFLRSMPMVLVTAAFSVGLVVLSAFVLTTDVTFRHEYLVDRQYKSIYMAVMMLVLAGHEAWRRRLLNSYLIGWTVFVLIALGLVLTGRASTVQHYSSARMSVLGMNENVQSTFAGSGAVIFLNYALFERRTRRFALWAVLYLLGLAAFIVGSSRTGLAGLLGGHLVVIATAFFGGGQRDARLNRWRVPVVTVFFLVGALSLAGQVGVFERAVSSMQARSEAALDGSDLGHREQLVAATLRVFGDNPAGVGMGRMFDFLQGSDPHNGYAKLLAEAGIAGVILFLLAMFAAARNARAWMRADPREIGVVAAFVLFALSGLTGQALIESPYWFFFAFLAVAPSGAGAASKRRAAAPA